MIELLNVLYVMTPGASLHIEHGTVRVEVEHETRLRVALIRLSGIVVLGRVNLSPYLIQQCAEDGRAIVWLDDRGRFKARVEGSTRGNVLLRRVQHLAVSDVERTTRIARQVVAAKIQNSRQVLLRGAREAAPGRDADALSDASGRLATSLLSLRSDPQLDVVRGIEGDAARAYFGVLDRLVRVDRAAFAMTRRTRRPPRDRMNAVLSFLYALLQAECTAALEGVGLDPYVGFLHTLRPGRPALALDLMEEFRSVLADRLALSLINRRQLAVTDFDDLPGGAVHLSDSGRRIVIGGFQRRKEEVLMHHVLQQKLPLGLVPHAQARLLARHLRGDLPDYPPYLYR